jgi:prevent-host-death family protein
MQKVSATRVQNNFGEVLDDVRVSGPVEITRKNRPVGVLIGFEAFSLMQERLKGLEDLVWGLQAKDAQREGYIGVEESEALMTELLDA